MGVKYLFSYAKSVGSFFEVNLRDEIEQIRVENGKAPLIVVDGIRFLSKCSSLFNFNSIESRILDFAGYFEKFIGCFKELGVQLVVFFDGVSWMDSKERWILKRKKGIQEHFLYFDEIKDCGMYSGKHNPMISNLWFNAIHILLDNDCEVRFSIDDCEAEIVAFAKENKCTAILTGDTDFIINAPCDIYFPTRTSMDKDLTFLKIDRRKLLKSLDINAEELPLLASLVGNNIIPSYEVSKLPKFKMANGYTDVISLFEYISSYIKKLHIEHEVPELTLQLISMDTFGNYEYLNLLRESISSYTIYSPSPRSICSPLDDENWNAITKKVYSHCVNYYTNRIFAVIVKMTYSHCQLVEDLRELDFPPINLFLVQLLTPLEQSTLFHQLSNTKFFGIDASVEVLQDLRKKIYGVLLFERPGDLEPVVEMVVDSVDNFEPKYVYPVFPKGRCSVYSFSYHSSSEKVIKIYQTSIRVGFHFHEVYHQVRYDGDVQPLQDLSAHHPGLLALWSELNYDSIKWNLLADLFNVDSEKLKTIPRKLLVPALSMKYLADRVMLEEWEVIAVVLSAVVTSLSTLDELRAVSVSWFQSRPIRLYSLVTTTYGALHFSLLALNGPISCSEYLPQNYQYGTVFHIIYKMLRFGMKPAYIVKTGFNMKEHVICEAQTRLIIDFVTGKN